MPGFRRYMFTVNDIPQDTTETINLDFPPEKIRYAIWKLEKAPTTGHMHLQGYCELFNSVSYGAAQKYFKPYKPHMEACKGTPDQCVAYILKTETAAGLPIEYGSRASQGERVDLRKAVTAFKDPKRNLKEILDDEDVASSFVKYHRGLEKYRAQFATVMKLRSPTVYVLCGPTGTGKTRIAMGGGPTVSDEVAAEALTKIYSKPHGDKWFDGYDGQIRLVIDEFTGWLPWAKLLQLCDKYPVLCETKGGMVNAAWEEVYITTNKLPKEWYRTKDQHWPAFVRRVSFWVWCPEEDQSTWEWCENYEYFESLAGGCRGGALSTTMTNDDIDMTHIS